MAMLRGGGPGPYNKDTLPGATDVGQCPFCATNQTSPTIGVVGNVVMHSTPWCSTFVGNAPDVFVDKVRKVRNTVRAVHDTIGPPPADPSPAA